MKNVRTGGCQCGAVRFRAASLLDNPHICHCRMCQKAAGNFFMALVGVPLEDFAWTRGRASVFKSSAQVERGFCAACGTPLSFQHADNQHISMAIGAFDEPAGIPLEFQLSVSDRLPQVAQLSDLVDYGTPEERDLQDGAEIRASSHQHPDHDTEVWPPA